MPQKLWLIVNVPTPSSRVEVEVEVEVARIQSYNRSHEVADKGRGGKSESRDGTRLFDCKWENVSRF
jgi:hypothetical protein